MDGMGFGAAVARVKVIESELPQGVSVVFGAPVRCPYCHDGVKKKVPNEFCTLCGTMTGIKQITVTGPNNNQL